MKIKPSRIGLFALAGALVGVVLFRLPGRAGDIAHPSRPHRRHEPVRVGHPFLVFQAEGARGPFRPQGQWIRHGQIGNHATGYRPPGAGVILDESFAGGDRLLVWAE